MNSNEPLNRIADATIRALIDHELEALGDHCIASQLRPIVMRAIEEAYKYGRIVEAR